jgi:hypothetical protein
MNDSPWNRCDVCGRFIPYEHFDGRATRRLGTPDSDYTSETWETLCETCVVGERQARAENALNAEDDASFCGAPDDETAAILQHPVVAL